MSPPFRKEKSEHLDGKSCSSPTYSFIIFYFSTSRVRTFIELQIPCPNVTTIFCLIMFSFSRIFTLAFKKWFLTCISFSLFLYSVMEETTWRYFLSTIQPLCHWHIILSWNIWNIKGDFWERGSNMVIYNFLVNGSYLGNILDQFWYSNFHVPCSPYWACSLLNF